MTLGLRNALLFIMTLTLGYLLWAITVLYQQNGTTLLVSTPMTKEQRQALNALQIQYQITHLKRLILAEHCAILESKLVIADIREKHPGLEAELSFNVAWPKDNVTAILSDTNVAPANTVPTKIKPTPTQVTAKSLDKKNLTPASLAKKENHLLHLSPQETKSFHALKHFIAEKRQSKPEILTSDEKVLLAMPTKHYTIQVFGARSPKTIQDFIEKHHLIHTRVFHSYYLNHPWYTLVLGKYKTYGDALNALKILPNMHEEPWIRPMSSVQAAIKLYR